MTTFVRDIANWVEQFAPRSLAETWDNVGLLWGDPSSQITKVMTCLTVTDRTATEAIETSAGLIVSHHPVLFKAVKSIRADQHETAYLWKLARAGIAIISPHTSFDNTVGGINDGLAQRLGLIDITSLRPGASVPRSKIVVFVPKGHRRAILDAAFAAGAGQIGAYKQCSFTTSGRGTFFGTEAAKPAIGEVGKRETVQEWRIEFVCASRIVEHVLAAIRQVHPYEEPATDVYPLKDGPPETPGAGRVGRLKEPLALQSLAQHVSDVLGANRLQFVGEATKPIHKLAIVCGAGDDFLPDAARAGADALLTGEARFHRGIEAEALGVGLLVAGHHATERPGVEDLAARLGRDFAQLEVWPSRAERDPFQVISVPAS